jgi:hypothetical protein
MLPPRREVAPETSMEKICGPHRGYFIVLSAHGADDCFTGRARITIVRPVPGEPVAVLEQVSSASSYPTRERAMCAAEHQARQVIEGMMPSWAPFTAPGVLN